MRLLCPASVRPGLALALAAAVAGVAGTGPAAAETTRPTLNFYGVTGLIDMPSGEMQPDAQLALTVAGFGAITRTTLTFQIAPWMQGSFRYTGLAGLILGGFGRGDVYYDRSFDLRIRLLREGRWQPSLTVGLQDFIGTGTFSGEYIAATKHITPRIKVTAGLGWGRFGTVNPIFSIGARPGPADPTGGTVNFGQWFRGPAAPFAGIEWQPTDRLGFKVEYSSDAYRLETSPRQGLFARRSSLNFGAEYEPVPGIRLGAYWLYGDRFGVAAHIQLNPKERAGGAFLYGPAPQPVALRPARAVAPAAWGESWAAGAAPAAGLRGPMTEALAAEGLALEALAVGPARAELRIRNLRYDATAQAVGRAARVMARVLPASVETFDIVPVEGNVAASRVTIRRSDLEALEFAPDAAAALRARVAFSDAAGPLPPGAVRGAGLYPRFSWSLGPYLATALFDPDNPWRADLGLRLSGRFDVAPGVVVSGSVIKKLVGNLDSATRASNSVLPRVRSEANIYNRADPVLETLTAAWYARPAENLYSRVTVGYLERMFGGVSAELLWKPVGSRLALGAEINYAQQRAFDGGLGFRSYGIVTGHVSAYYAFDNGYHAQIDVGRYLAGDYGATVSLDREFANGWRVGAFATLTDVPFSRFGEGSFDKGIRLTIPLNAIAGQPSRLSTSALIRPVQRDGGARLAVDGRLYEAVRGAHGPALDASWGRVWR